MALLSSKKTELFTKYGKNAKDTGSPESQIALFSSRIAELFFPSEREFICETNVDCWQLENEP